MVSWCWSLLEQLQQWDAELSRQVAGRIVRRPNYSLLYWLAQVGAHLGDSWLWLIVAGLLWRRAHSQRRQDGGRGVTLVNAGIVSVLATIGLTLWIKRQFRRQRPGTAQWLYGAGPDVHSFPSGHAARLSTIAVWVSLCWPPYAGWAWLLTGYVGWSRVALGIHYLGDVGSGWLLGGAVGVAGWGMQRHLARMNRQQDKKTTR